MKILQIAILNWKLLYKELQPIMTIRTLIILFIVKVGMPEYWVAFSIMKYFVREKLCLFPAKVNVVA